MILNLGGRKMTRGEYKTPGKQQLVDFLYENRDRDFTVEQIVDGLSGKDGAPGKSTVYRLVSKLLESGEIRRFEHPSSSSFVYQYSEHTPDCEHHFHLKCVKCGRLIHMDCEKMTAVKAHILKEHDFIIGGELVINGICVACSK